MLASTETEEEVDTITGCYSVRMPITAGSTYGEKLELYDRNTSIPLISGDHILSESTLDKQQVSSAKSKEGKNNAYKFVFIIYSQSILISICTFS